MSIKAITVIEEFLRSPTEQYRKNAVTALAALGDKDSVGRLTSIALTEHDAAVRVRAEQEILSLNGEQLDYAVWLLEEATEDPARRRIANGILGRLNDQGQIINPPRKPLLTRLRLAHSLHRYLYPSRTVRFRFRAWKSGLLGGLIGNVMLAAIIILTGHWEAEGTSGYFGIAIGMLALSFIAAILTTQRACPISFHRDLLAAILVEPVVASYFCFFGAAITMLFYYFGSIPHSPPFSKMLLMACLITGMAGVVRVGVIIGHGAFSGRLINKAAQVTTGLILALLSMTLIFFIGWLKTSGDDSGVNLYHFMSWMLNPESTRVWFWVFLTPLTITVAYAFAKLDNELGPVRRRASGGRKRFFLYLVTVAGALLFSATTTLRQERKAKLTGDGYVTSVTFSPDGKQIFSYGLDTQWNRNVIQIWDTTSRQKITPPPAIDGAKSIAFSPNGKLLAIAKDDALYISDPKNWQKIMEFKGSCFTPAFSPDGKLLAADNYSYVQIWTTNTWESFRFYVQERPEALVFFPDGRQLAVAISSGIQIWDLNTKVAVGMIPRHAYQPVAVSADSNLFAAGDSYSVLVGNTGQPKNPTASIYFAVPPLALTFSPDNKLLAVGEGSSIKLVDISSQRVTCILKGGRAYIKHLAFSPDNKIIAALYDDNTIKLWDEWKWKKTP